MTTIPQKNYPAWDDHAAWDKLAKAADDALEAKCLRCGVCNGCYLHPGNASSEDWSAYEMNTRLKKCRCCAYCRDRALTTRENYKGGQCVSVANRTLCFWTEEQRLEHYASVVAHGTKGRPCTACCVHFEFLQSKK